MTTTPPTLPAGEADLVKRTLEKLKDDAADSLSALLCAAGATQALLFEALQRVGSLERELAIARAEAAGAQGLLLDVQSDCGGLARQLESGRALLLEAKASGWGNNFTPDREALHAWLTKLGASLHG